MKTKVVIGIVIFIIVAIIAISIIFSNTNDYNNTENSDYCTDNTHREVYPVNPYCTKCKGRDGIVPHECTNPNGIDKFCPSCGKIVKNK